MNKLLSIVLTLVFILFAFNIDAQKTIVHERKRENRTVVHKGKRGKTTVVRKKSNGNVSVHKSHRRVKRTIDVNYHYHHLPGRGAVVTKLHANALTYKFGGIGYRYYSGVWYKPHLSKWIVVRPPLGVRIKVLPVGYRKIVIGPSIYYYYYGTYYAENNNGYEVIEAPLGAEVDSLPTGYTTVNIDDNEYYELDGNYYLPSLSEDGEEILVVVKKPEP